MGETGMLVISTNTHGNHALSIQLGMQFAELPCMRLGDARCGLPDLSTRHQSSPPLRGALFPYSSRATMLFTSPSHSA